MTLITGMTRIRDIVVTMDEDNGEIIPVAQFEQAVVRTEYAQRAFTQAALRGVDDVERMDLRIGDMVTIGLAVRGQDAAIKSVLHDSRQTSMPQWQPPTRCPLCRGALENVNGRIVCKTYFEHGAH